jgi:hypothetical protein
MNKEPRYVTVVFEVRDNEGFEPMADTLRNLFVTQEKSVRAPYTVVGMSIGNEFNRMELIEQVVQDECGRIGDPEYQIRAIEEILALPHENTYALGLEVIKNWSDDE